MPTPSFGHKREASAAHRLRACKNQLAGFCLRTEGARNTIGNKSEL